MTPEENTDKAQTTTGVSVPSKPSGLTRVWKALFHSMEGLGAAFKHEAAFRQEVFAAVFLVPAALLLPLGTVEKVLLIGAVLLVLIAELLNTAVENCIDYISFDKHPFAKRAKDIGSAAVFLSLVNCALAWVLILATAW